MNTNYLITTVLCAISIICGFFLRGFIDTKIPKKYKLTKSVEKREYVDGPMPTYVVRIESREDIVYEDFCSFGFINDSIIENMNKKAQNIIEKLNKFKINEP